MHLALSPASPNICVVANLARAAFNMNGAKKLSKSPARSKSSTLDVLRLVGRGQKKVRRSRSMPLRLRAAVSDSEEQVGKVHGPCQYEKTCSPEAPPLNRWSSAPAGEFLLPTACSMTPSRARSMRNLRILPPRQPTRRSGKAEELRSALPPKCPMRKPGDAIMASHALPPFLPKRFMDQDSLPCCNSSNEMNLMNSFAFCNINNASFVSHLSDDSDSSLEIDEDDFEFTSSSSVPRAVTIRANIRRVLGDVLEQLDDDDDFGVSSAGRG